MRARAHVLGLQRRAVERFVDIGSDRAGFVQREVAVLQDRDAVERMQRKMGGRTHLGFEIPECVRNLFVGERQSRDMDEGAAWESEDDDIRHDRQPPGDMNLRPGKVGIALRAKHLFSTLA